MLSAYLGVRGVRVCVRECKLTLWKTWVFHYQREAKKNKSKNSSGLLWGPSLDILTQVVTFLKILPVERVMCLKSWRGGRAWFRGHRCLELSVSLHSVSPAARFSLSHLTCTCPLPPAPVNGCSHVLSHSLLSCLCRDFFFLAFSIPHLLIPTNPASKRKTLRIHTPSEGKQRLKK